MVKTRKNCAPTLDGDIFKEVSPILFQSVDETPVDENMDYAEHFLNQGKHPVKPMPMPISRQEIFALANGLDDYDKSLLYALYLTGARASELTEIKVTDFEFVTAQDGKQIVKVKVNTRKKRVGIPFRELSLTSNSDTEMAMLELVLRHRTTFQRLGHALMYPYNRKTLWKKLMPITFTTTLIRYKPLRSEPNQLQHLYPHYLRHCRATHLVSEYGFREFDLQQYMGWSSVAPAIFYVSLDWRDADRLLRGLPSFTARQPDQLPNPKETETLGQNGSSEELREDEQPQTPGE